MHRTTETTPEARRARTGRMAGLALALALASSATPTLADVPGRAIPRGTVPNPGTQQQELSNITLPAPYNVFEFTVTCAGCHGGTIDQQTAHFGVQGGTAMASAARDPVFRANQIAINDRIKAVTAEDGAGNMCMRCHSPNGWYSGRFDPTLGGDAQGKTMMHSIVASTDDEGISCETCHRAVGNVKFKDAKQSPTDPVWNMLAGVGGYPNDKGWPHDGAPITSINPGDPYGDTTLQYSDGMSYGGPYAGTIAPSFSDDQNIIAGSNLFAGFNVGTYTGQIFAVYPPGYVLTDRFGKSTPLTGPVKNVDGSLSPTFDQPVNAPYVYDASGNVVVDPVTRLPLVDLQAQSISIEHPTFKNNFLVSSEMCASCHELTVPVASHGMPEQRTFTEWKYSAYAQANAFSAGLPGTPAVPAGAIKTFNSLAGEIRCQDCHMPKLKHEYDDVSPVSLNADPVLVGWFPYAKDRNDTGGTSSHKHAGANRDLPDYMKLLYPEPDLEVIGAPTGNDIRVFPGMLSTRDPMFTRTQRNSELSMRDAVELKVVSGPAATATAGVYQVTVRVTNRTGHKIPSGYPDGRRLFLSLVARDAAGAPVYTSGLYDEAAADLRTDAATPFNRALTSFIDATVQNAVMVYERVTCKDNFLVTNTPGTCAPGTSGPDLLNNAIQFDNRIPPAGFDYARYQTGGARFWTYDPVPNATGELAYHEDATRYPAGQGFDLVTYQFAAASPPASVRVTANWQTHTREYMEHLRDQDASTVRPEGPVNAFMPGYPLTPAYLSDVVINRAAGLPWYSGPSATSWATFTSSRPEIRQALSDNWGGVAYAAWALTGKGAPYPVAVADTSVAKVPAAVGAVAAGTPTPADVVNQTTSSFETLLTWAPSAAADKVEGYEVWIRYGIDASNAPAGPDVAGSVASWERLAVVAPTAIDLKGQVHLLNAAVNLGKTYGYAVRAFNAAGYGPFSPVTTFKTPWDFPLPPDLLQVLGAPTATTVTLTWTDTADNECGFKVQAQVATVNGAAPAALAPFADVATFATQTGASTGACVALNSFGGNQNTVTGLQPNTCYNFQVYAYNGTGPSTMNTNGPVRACTPAGAPVAPTGLKATASGTSTIQLTWNAVAATAAVPVTGYLVQSVPAGAVPAIPVPAATTSQVVSGLTPGTAYTFVVFAVNASGSSPASAPATATILAQLPPPGPTGAARTAGFTGGFPSITLAWTTPAGSNATSVSILRRTGNGPYAPYKTVAAAIGAQSFVDTAVLAGTSYGYQLQAVNAAAQASGLVTVGNVTTGNVPNNSSPSNVGLTVRRVPANAATDTATISWTNRAPAAAIFNLQVQVNGGAWTAVPASISGLLNTWTVTGLTRRQANNPIQYRYRIRAVSASGATTGWTNSPQVNAQ